ncbi:MAG: hypothetical protein JWM00_9 [Candidatus Saccharibacteria bacterium]|nr:hypothetical protein [Candidatus Saccharibacteria bacterium]
MYNMPRLRLERSVASSGKLLKKHAPFYFLAADVATLALWFIAQALKNFFNVKWYSYRYVGKGSWYGGSDSSKCVAIFCHHLNSIAGRAIRNTSGFSLSVYYAL